MSCPTAPEPQDDSTDRTPQAQGALPMSGSQMAKNAVAYWVATGVGLVGSLLRGKVAATVLGATGVGITAQLATFSTLVVALAALGLGTAGIKLIAQARGKGDEAEIRSLVSFLVWAPTAAGLGLFLVVVVFARPLAQLLLGNQKYALLLIAASVTVPLSILLAAFQLVMQAFEQARRLAVNAVITAVLVTLSAVPLTIEFGVEGAVAAGPVSAAATLVFFCLREPWVLRLAFPLRRLRRDSGAQMRVLAGASLLASLLGLGADTVLRGATVRLLGLAANGLYQPVQMLTTVVLAQMAGALTLVLLPRLSLQLSQDRTGVLQTLGRAAETTTIFVVPLILVLMGLRDVFILAFFDREFLGISTVLALQLTGELPRFVAFGLGAVLLPAGLVKQWLLTAVAAAAVRLVLGLALLPLIGLPALAVGAVAQWVAVLAYTMWVLHRRLGWAPDSHLVRLLFAGALTVTLGCAAALYLPGQALLLVGAALVWVALLGRREIGHFTRAIAPRMVGRA